MERDTVRADDEFVEAEVIDPADSSAGHRKQAGTVGAPPVPDDEPAPDRATERRWYPV